MYLILTFLSGREEFTVVTVLRVDVPGQLVPEDEVGVGGRE